MESWAACPIPNSYEPPNQAGSQGGREPLTGGRRSLRRFIANAKFLLGGIPEAIKITDKL